MKRSNAISEMLDMIIKGYVSSSTSNSPFSKSSFRSRDGQHSSLEVLIPIAAMITGGVVDLAKLSNIEFNKIFKLLLDEYIREKKFFVETLTKEDTFQLIFKTVCDEKARRTMEKAPDFVSDERGGFVYLLGDNQSRYKIGKAINPLKRQKRITKGASPYFLLHTIPTNDDYSLESEFHQEYGSKRTRGEWFALSESEVREILKIKTREFGSDGIVRKYTCQQIKQAAQTNSESINTTQYQAGWQTGFSDGSGDMVIGYSCNSLDSSYCTGYLTAYGVASGENLSGTVFNWNAYPKCEADNDEQE